MTATEAQDQTEYWCSRLGLDDWQIAVKFVEGDDVSKDAWSKSYINQSKQKATIVLAEGRTDEQQAKSILHELVHVVLYSMWLIVEQGDNAKECARAEEKTVRRLTKALSYKEENNGQTDKP